MTARACALLLLVAPSAAAGEAPFLVTALWEKATAKQPAAVVLRFSPDAPDLRVNRVPAPRVEWPQGVDVQPVEAPASIEVRPAATDTTDSQYFGDGEPFRLYFSNAPGQGLVVEGKVVFFYCSKNAGWCKKGVSAVSVALP